MYGLHDDVAFATSLAWWILSRPLAFCSGLCHLHLQSCANKGKTWHAFSNGGILWNQDWLSSFMPSMSIWLSLLRTGLQTSRWKEDSQMGTTIPKGTISRIFQGTCHDYWYDPKYSYWTYQSSIPCCFWQRLLCCRIGKHSWSHGNMDRTFPQLTWALSWRTWSFCWWSSSWVRSWLHTWWSWYSQSRRSSFGTTVSRQTFVWHQSVSPQPGMAVQPEPTASSLAPAPAVVPQEPLCDTPPEAAQQQPSPWCIGWSDIEFAPPQESHHDPAPPPPPQEEVPASPLHPRHSTRSREQWSEPPLTYKSLGETQVLLCEVKGLYVQPHQGTLSLDCHVDADYAGNWTLTEATNPKAVKSRAGYMITLGNFPVLWKSKHIQEICLSTMESECISLSMATQSLVYLHGLLFEIDSIFDLDLNNRLSLMSTVFEDNQPALTLANTDPPCMTPRSKSLAVKYHWFHSKLSPTTIVVKYVASGDNVVDIFTKALPLNAFTKHCRTLCSWWPTFQIEGKCHGP